MMFLPSDYLANVMLGDKAKLWERRLVPQVDFQKLAITVAEVNFDLAVFTCFVFLHVDPPAVRPVYGLV